MPDSVFQNIIPEILGQIFLFCLPDDSSPILPTPSSTDAPLKLGRVCSHWRQVSHLTPALWSSLEIRVDGHHYGKSLKALDRRFARAVEVFVSRSRILPISIAFMWSSGLLGGMQLVRKQLLLYSSRWKLLRLDAPYNVVLPFMEVLGGEVPWLETLEVRTQYTMESSIDIYLDNVPRLSHVCLSNGIYSLQSSASLSSLRRLTLTRHESINQCIHWLHQCPALEHLCLDFDTAFINPSSADDHQGVVQQELPLLTSLTLRSNLTTSDKYPSHLLLHHLQTPSLRFLSLSIHSECQQPQLQQHQLTLYLFDFLQRSSPPLETLSLDFPQGCDDDLLLVDILSLIPLLQNLGLNASLANDTLIEALKSHSPRPSSCNDATHIGDLCPQLCRIKLLTADGNLSESALIDIISSRCGNTCTTGHIQDDQDQRLERRKPSFRRLNHVLSDDCTNNKSISSFENNPTIANCIDQGLMLNARNRR